MKLTTPRDLYQALCPHPTVVTELLRPVFENVAATLVKDGRKPTGDEILFVKDAIKEAKAAARRATFALGALYAAVGEMAPDGLQTAYSGFHEEMEGLEESVLRTLLSSARVTS